jgi:hypothetical protein
MLAAYILAKQTAKRRVQEELREQGVRVTLVKPAEIAAQAQRYLAEHPEVYLDALKVAQHLALRKTLGNRKGRIYWGELEQGIYELVRRKFAVYRSETTKRGTDKTEEIRATEG